MKLTDKCKQDFEKWLRNKKYKCYGECYLDTSTDLWIVAKINLDADDVFYQLPFSMQIGVFEDFFDQTEVINNFFIFKTKSNKYSIVHSGIIQKEEWESRPEARKQAILKANMIHNETN